MPSLRAALGLLVGALASHALAACSSNLLIDNFGSYSSHTNSLGSWTSDDGSMTSISAASNILKFKPGASGYFYETFPCQQAQTNGYNAITFTVKGPSGGSFALEAQSKTTCSASAYKSVWKDVSGLTGQSQTITVPLSDFSGLNANAITALVWSEFSGPTTEWQISNVSLRCGGGGGGSSSTTPPTTSSTKTTSSTNPPSSSTKTTSSTNPPSSSTKTTSSTNPPSSSTKTTSSTNSPSSTNTPTTSSTKTTTSGTTVSPSTPSTSPTATGGTCPHLVVEDFISQSRLTFLHYNALGNPTSDDGTMTSVVVSPGNKCALTPSGANSYFYSKIGCVNVNNVYGGITLKIKAAAGTKFDVQLASASTCGEDDKYSTQTSAQLGWTFDGTEKTYSIPFNKFSGLDMSKLSTVLFAGLTKPVTLGPIALYCGNTPVPYTPTGGNTSPDPVSTVAAPTGTGAAFVIDSFAGQNSNALGFWHGGDDGMGLSWGSNRLTITSNDADYSFYTQVSGSCKDMKSYDKSYLHVAYSGSTKFTIALQQHNSGCNSEVAPYPETWDSIEASRYASNGHIYIPISHFNINLARVIGIAFKGFYTSEPVTLTKVEIVNAVPAGFSIPNKLPSGSLVFACKRPNSFAFAIDDGDPAFAQQVLEVIRSENIKVTFFTVGAPLADPSTNLSNVYNEMLSQGHQVALHSYTHPKMEGLPDYASIDWEYEMDIKAVETHLNGLHTPYFRPPFGTEGARMRQRLARAVGNDNPYIVNWSVDVEDWLWATSSTPEKQLDAFRRDVGKGGNLVVLHYLYPSTVQYLRQFIQIAKATGKQLMRVDQCLEDPNAPPL